MLGSVSFAYVVRLTRSAVADNAQADYVRTATAKGQSRPRVVAVHVLRNSLIPVVTFLGADLGALMGGAIVTEGIFNIHGVGGALYQAVTRQEAPTVVVDRDGPGDGVPAGQPAGRSALRRAGPADPYG